jgi:hypothetical protein
VPNDYSALSVKERQIIRRLNSPPKVQQFVNELVYNQNDRVSILDVIRKGTGDCLEAAVFASVVLACHKIPNSLVGLKSVRDEDHALCVFKQEHGYGAIAQSKYLGLRYRNPVYASHRELVMSYFESYYNYFGEYTLRGFSKPLLLRSITKAQLADTTYMCELDDRLSELPCTQLVPASITLPRVSPLKFKQEVLVIPKGERVGKQYRRR